MSHRDGIRTDETIPGVIAVPDRGPGELQAIIFEKGLKLEVVCMLEVVAIKYSEQKSIKWSLYAPIYEGGLASMIYSITCSFHFSTIDCV